MVHRLIGKQYDFGRLYNYTSLANSVARICGRRAYYTTNGNEEDNAFAPQLHDRLIDFDPEKWQKVMNQFVGLRESLIRRDASFIVLPTEIDDVQGADEEDPDMYPDEDDEVDPERESMDAFSVFYIQVKDLIKFHTCLSCVQPQLDNAIRKGTDVIPLENIAALHRAIGDLFDDEEDNKYANILKSLFERNRRTRSNRTGDLCLKPFDEIKKIYKANSRVFDLERFQRKFHELIRQWTKLVLPVPNLAKYGYGSTDKKNEEENTGEQEALMSHEENIEFHDARDDTLSESSSSNESQIKQALRNRQPSEEITKPKKKSTKEADASGEEDQIPSNKVEGVLEPVANLKRKRDSFSDKVKDPLEESISRAASLPTRKVTESSPSRSLVGGTKRVISRLCDRKESAHQLVFTDSESLEDDVVMSAVPERLKKPESNHPAPHPVKIYVDHQRPVSKKRKRFTETEDLAIMHGVERFGPGKWTEIKSHFSMELKDRDTVQIKDRYRTMTKSAE
eukprot:CCRYP_006247-RA/>CCRYP_006247-RA protein AED:0.03 eAED:0.03 QI:441/1/1/1/0.5/0.66/3/112/508